MAWRERVKKLKESRLKELDGVDIQSIIAAGDKEIYNTIPDSVFSKPYLPLCTQVWKFFKYMDWQYFDSIYADFAEACLDELVLRMEEAIEVSKTYSEGKLKDPKKTICYWILPPVLVVRADLIQGAIRLVYGNSADITFMGVSDFDKEVLFGINFHFENGLATNYWYMRPGDEFLDKRHMKLGTKLKDLPKEIPDFHEAGSKIRDILLDVRNIQDPDHAQSAYNVCLFLMSAGPNNGVFISNFDEYSFMWEGINSYKLNEDCNTDILKDTVQFYEPWPPIFLQLTRLKRELWIKRIAGLLIDKQLYCQYVLNKKLFDILPVKEVLEKDWEEGVPTPAQTIAHELSDYKNWRFGYKLPEGPRIHYEDFGLSFKDALGGFLTDITWQTEPPFTRDNLVSIGHGLNTKIIKKDDST
ncbi:MAG: hypothetical protein ACFFCM_01165 [Promethearchaeota archaeon]